MAKTSVSVIAAKTAVHAAVLAPIALLGWQFWQVWQQGSDALGADPVAEIEHRTGLWALRLLLITLAITPLRQLTGQAVLIRFRRMLGLYAFFYASVHLTAYLWLDLRGFWTQILKRSSNARTSRSASPPGCCWCPWRSPRLKAGCGGSSATGAGCTC